MGELFRGSSPELITLLESLLNFDPNLRPTVSECIQNKIFDEIRNPDFEKGAAWKFILECDEKDDCDFDIKEMRQIISNEIK
jgi:serine/threonine protein kinase